MANHETPVPQKPEARMNWMTVLVIMTVFSLVAYFIVSSLMNKMEAGRAAEAQAVAQAQAEREAQAASQEAPAEEAAPAEAAVATASAEPASGEEVYGRVCVACHQADGKGVQGAFPPLAGSEWVTGDAERFAKVVLRGLSGHITVNGTKYNGSMPPWGSTLNDQEIAAVMTYVRANFGNAAAPVDAATVTQVREATASRSKPFTAEEL